MTNGKMVAEDHKLTYDLQAPERSSCIERCSEMQTDNERRF